MDIKQTRVGFLRRFSVATGLALLVCGLPVIQGMAQTPEPPPLPQVAGQQPDSIAVEVEYDSTEPLTPGQSTTAIVTLHSQTSDACLGTPTRPVDAVVVIDTSPSTGRPGAGSNLARGQEILRSLWTQMNQPIQITSGGLAASSRLGLVTVDIGVTEPEVSVRLPLTNSTAMIDTTISELVTGADSKFDEGIARAAEILDETARPDAAQALIILFHDNFFSLQPGVIAATQLASANDHPVFVVINTTNVPLIEQLIPEQAVVLTNALDHIFVDPTPNDLRRLFVTASGSDSTVAGRNLQVDASFDPAEMVEITRVENGGRLENGHILWNINEVVTDSPIDLRFHFSLRPDAPSDIRPRITIRGLDCNGYALTTEAVDLPSLQVTSEPGTATPPGNDLATATPVSVIVVTPAAPGGIEGTWRIPGLEIVVPGWLPYLLLALLLFILLLLLWRWWRSRRRPKQVRAERPGPVTGTPGATLPSPRKPETGETNLPGRLAAPDDLLVQLRTASSFTGHIPTGTQGIARSHLVVKTYQSPNDLKASGGLNLERMGSQFVWQRGNDGELAVPTATLQSILQERVTAASPLVAIWTEEPADNMRIDVRVTPNVPARRLDVQVRSVYRPAVAGQSPGAPSYFLHLKFLNNPQGYAISLLPVMEVEGN